MGLRLISDKTQLNFFKYRFFSFGGSILFSIISLILFFIFGLNYGIDFKGGILIEIKTTENMSVSQLRNNLKNLNLGEISIQEFGSSDNILMRIERQPGDDKNQQIAIEKIRNLMADTYGEDIVEYRRVEFVGPTVSKDLIRNGIIAVILAIGAMLIYIWFRFELPFALGAVFALINDIILTIGVFVITGLEYNLATVAAILLIIGYSMNDTVVIFDRIRENLRKYRKLPLNDLLDKSINETLNRTVNTTATTILALGALYFIGGQIIRDFSFAMIWGILVGTYSSIFIASPLLFYFKLRPNENKLEKN